MFCYNCGAKAFKEDNFCRVCGAKIKSNVEVKIVDSPSETEVFDKEKLNKLEEFNTKPISEIEEVIGEYDKKITSELEKHKKSFDENSKDFIGPKSNQEPEDKVRDLTAPTPNITDEMIKNNESEEFTLTTGPNIDSNDTVEVNIPKDDDTRESVSSVEGSGSREQKSLKQKWKDFINEDDDEYSIFSGMEKKKETPQPTETEKTSEKLSTESTTMGDIPSKEDEANSKYKSLTNKELAKIVNEELEKESKKDLTKNSELKSENRENIINSKDKDKNIPSEVKSKKPTTSVQTQEENKEGVISLLKSKVKNFEGKLSNKADKENPKTQANNTATKEKEVPTNSEVIKTVNSAKSTPSTVNESIKKKEHSKKTKVLNKDNGKRNSKKSADITSTNDTVIISKNGISSTDATSKKETIKDKKIISKVKNPINKAALASKSEDNIKNLGNKMSVANEKVFPMINKLLETGSKSIYILALVAIVITILPIILVSERLSIIIAIFTILKIALTFFEYYYPLSVGLEHSEITINQNSKIIASLVNLILCQGVILILFLLAPRDEVMGYNLLGALTPSLFPTILLFILTTLIALILFWPRLSRRDKISFTGWYVITFVAIELLLKLFWIIVNFFFTTLI